MEESQEQCLGVRIKLIEPSSDRFEFWRLTRVASWAPNGWEGVALGASQPVVIGSDSTTKWR